MFYSQICGQSETNRLQSRGQRGRKCQTYQRTQGRNTEITGTSKAGGHRCTRR